MAPWQALPAERPLSFAQSRVKHPDFTDCALPCTACPHSTTRHSTHGLHGHQEDSILLIQHLLFAFCRCSERSPFPQYQCYPTMGMPVSSPQHSPQSCSSEASAQSVMPLQCLLVEMQVPLGHWKPLHFFSEIR